LLKELTKVNKVGILACPKALTKYTFCRLLKGSLVELTRALLFVDSLYTSEDFTSIVKFLYTFEGPTRGDLLVLYILKSPISRAY
jgi:hypothetical protein